VIEKFVHSMADAASPTGRLCWWASDHVVYLVYLLNTFSRMGIDVSRVGLLTRFSARHVRTYGS